MKNIFTVLLALFSFSAIAQVNDITSSLYDSYSKYKEQSLDKRRIKHDDIQPLINKLKNHSAYTVKKVGESIKGKSISLISVGNGPTNIFLWSQMHGNEPTATQAIFDIFNFLNSFYDKFGAKATFLFFPTNINL